MISFKAKIFCIIIMALNVLHAHIPEGNGSALQLYSYLTNTPPKINGNLTDRVNNVGSASSGTTNDEWKDAYTRTIQLDDGQEATLFFMNTADSLYVGISYEHGNNGSPNGIDLYFDQGSTGGTHDILLTGNSTTPNENAIITTTGTISDRSWNGSAWTEEGGTPDVNMAHSYFTNVFHWEFAIPLKNGKSGDLAINSTEELGFLIVIKKNGGGGGDRFWKETNGNPADASGWADLKLGLSKNFTTFYASYGANGTPQAIDGVIRGGTDAFTDDAWRGSFQRDIALTNFAGKKINATLFAIDNPGSNSVYVGLDIRDNVQNAGDYCRIYQEVHNSTPANAPDFILNNNKENMLEATTSPFSGDYTWNNNASPPSWQKDSEGADGQNAMGKFYTSHYEYEYLLIHDNSSEDIHLNTNGECGFIIEYHDADQPVGEQNFYWEYTTNSTSVLLDENATPNLYGSMGWSTLKLGAPYVQVIYPVDNKTVDGSVNIRIFAEDENSNGIVSAQFYRKADSSKKYTLQRIGLTQEWNGIWDVSDLPNGPDTLVFEVTDDDNITIERLVSLTIKNANGSTARPKVIVNTPTPGDTLTGVRKIQFSVDPGTGNTIKAVDLYLDGKLFKLDSTATEFQFNSADYADGYHSFRIIATNDAGISGSTEQIGYYFRNTPTVTLNSPASGSSVSGETTISFSIQASTTITKREVFIDGGLVGASTTDSTFIWNTTKLKDGQHLIQVVVTDSNGKIGKSSIISVTTINQPGVKIISPVGGATVSGVVTVKYRALVTTPATIINQELIVDGNILTVNKTDSTFTLNSLELNDGEHTIQVRVTDSEGKVAESAIQTITTKNSPTVEILSPTTDSILSALTEIRFKAIPSGSNSISNSEIYIDGIKIADSQNDSSYLWNTMSHRDGNHTIEVTVIDNTGKKGTSKPILVIVQNTPSIIITKPQAGEIINGIYTVLFNEKRIDTVGVLKREISIDGDTWDTTAVLDSTYSLATTNLTNGTHSVTMRITDHKGRIKTSQKRLFIVDNEGPVLSQPLVKYPHNGVAVKKDSVLTVSIFIKDIHAGMGTAPYITVGTNTIPFVLKDDGTGSDSIPFDNTYTTTIPVSSTTSEKLSYTVYASDKLNNQSTITGTFLIDNTPPQLANFVISPNPKLINGIKNVFTSQIKLIGTYSDVGGAGILRGTIIVKDINGKHINNSPIELSPLDNSFSKIVSLSEGTNAITITLEDKAGNRSEKVESIVYTVVKVSTKIDKEGGAVIAPDGASLTVPQFALQKSETISITKLSADNYPQSIDKTIKRVGIPYSFSPSNLPLRKDAILAIPYTLSDLDKNNDGLPDFDISKLTIVYWSGTAWQSIGNAEINTANQLVSLSVNHLGVFDLAEVQAPVVEELISFWSNNPVRSQKGSQFSVYAPETGSISLSIHDLSGDLVCQLIKKNSEIQGKSHKTVLWRGNNVSDQFAGPGTYIYVFTYTNSVSGKTTIIRKPIGLLK